jgi:hypothetical protein
VKLALNIFAARIILEAARNALMWMWVEVLTFKSRPAATEQAKPPEIAKHEPEPAGAFIAHDASTYF